MTNIAIEHKRTKKTSVSEKQKSQLYPIVLKLFSEKEYHQVNMREISKLSGISLATIYRYFPSKEELVFTVLDEKASTLAENSKSQIRGMVDTKEIFRRLFWVSLDNYDQNPEVAVLTHVSIPPLKWIRSRFFKAEWTSDLLQEILKGGLERNEIASEITLTEIRDVYYMYLQRQVTIWYYHGMKWRLVDTIPRFFEFAWKVITT